MSLSWSEGRIEAGDDITLRVDVAERPSLVGVLVVDEAAKWAGSRNDITMETVRTTAAARLRCDKLKIMPNNGELVNFRSVMYVHVIVAHTAPSTAASSGFYWTPCTGKLDPPPPLWSSWKWLCGTLGPDPDLLQCVGSGTLPGSQPGAGENNKPY